MVHRSPLWETTDPGSTYAPAGTPPVFPDVSHGVLQEVRTEYGFVVSLDKNFVKIVEV